MPSLFPYQSPGAAFSDAIEQSLIERQLLAHKQFEDRLAMMREARLAKAAATEDEYNKAILEEHKAKAAQDRLKAQRAEADATLEGMMPGDIPDAMTAQKIKSVYPNFVQNQPASAPIPSVRIAGPVTGPQAVAPQPTGQTAEQPTLPTFMGTPEQRQMQTISRVLQSGAQDETPQQTFLRLMPLARSPQELASFGKLAEARGAQGGATERPEVFVDPVHRTVQVLGPNGLTPIRGPLPPNAHTNVVPQPPSPVIIQTDNGVMRAPRGGGAATPVLDASGTPIKPKSTAAEKSRDFSVKTATRAVDRLDADIDAADKAGLLGPAAGRWYDLLATAGSTGDPQKDALLGQIEADLTLTKMHVDAGIGGSRAAASPLLMRNWKDLALHGSRSLLRGYTTSMRADLAGDGSTTPATPQDGWIDLGGGVRVRRKPQ